MAVVTSQRFSINWHDILKALKMTVILPALTLIYQSIEAGNFDIDWKAIGKAAALGLIGYLIKQFFFEPAKIIIEPASKEEAAAIKSGEAEVIVQTK